MKVYKIVYSIIIVIFINVFYLNAFSEDIEIENDESLIILEDNAESLEEKSNNKNIDNTIINTKNIILLLLILLSISLIVITIVLLKLLSWRAQVIDKVVKDGNVLQFPHETNELIKGSQENIFNFVQQLADIIKKETELNKETGLNTQDKIISVEEQLTIFRNKIESTESELRRYKEGYDYNIKKSYLDHLIKLNSICSAEKNIENNETLFALNELIEDYLDQEEISKYNLEINKSIHGQRDARTLTEDTSEEKNAGLVIENIESGYLIKLPDGEKILKPAYVKIFKYNKKEENKDG